jgi:hypothetical protein
MQHYRAFSSPYAKGLVRVFTLLEPGDLCCLSAMRRLSLIGFVRPREKEGLNSTSSCSPPPTPNSEASLEPSSLSKRSAMPSSDSTPLLPASSPAARRHSSRIKLFILLAAFATLAIVGVSITLTSKLGSDEGPEDPLERANWLLGRSVDFTWPSRGTERKGRKERIEFSPRWSLLNKLVAFLPPLPPPLPRPLHLARKDLCLSA